MNRLLSEFVYECDSQRIDLNPSLWHVLDVKSMFDAHHKVMPKHVIY
jgi:hypothetical protein